MPTGQVRVLEPGLLTTIQDASGRPGLGRYGIPPGGAMDVRAARLANCLVGGGGEEAVLELTLQGPRLEWLSGAHIGLAGADLGAMSDGRHLAPGHSYRVGPGAALDFGVAQGGARAYLAVQGGFEAAIVLGSVSTDRRSGFGGLDGRALRAGDVLRFAGSQDGPLRSAVRPAVDGDERIAFIPTEGSLRSLSPAAVRTFCATEWRVAPDSDRSGIRLTGDAPLPASMASIPSLPVPVGAVQVPPGGQPIIKMVDGPVTGGYPVLGVIPSVAHSRLAQMAPGATLRFRRISVAAARRLTRSVGVSELIELDEGDIAASWAR